MKIKSEATRKLSKEVVSKMVKRDSEGWPPNCGIFIYQPKRPHKIQEELTPRPPVRREKN